MKQDKRSNSQSRHSKLKRDTSSVECSNDSRVLSLELPIRLMSEANLKDHWTKKRKRRLLQQRIIACEWKARNLHISLPALIKLVRIAPRSLDDDNLVSAFKWQRDQISDLITPGLAKGRADNVEGLSFAYGQEKGGKGEYKVRIEIYQGSSSA